ncbi:anaerobic C4-dicarboxylate transporter family protein, partial [Campylobacter coli]|uniref:anaerobic C4-dicarboxylate transporter family protein n=1 Tax=Campylobacter coli TaxID=195 RepID=UPI001C548C41
MDIMIILQVIVLLGSIFIGIRLGGIAIGYAGGLGVVVLGLVLGMKPGNIPWVVLLIIAAAIAAISALLQASGLDYMVWVTVKILISKLKLINYLAPAFGWFLTFLAGT